MNPASNNDWLHQITEFFYRLSNRYSLVVICLLYAYFLSTIMPAETAKMAEYTSEWGIPDGQFFYTSDIFYREISQWPEAGIEGYIHFRLTLDIVWALVYTSFLITSISLCLAATTHSTDWQRSLNVFPLIPMCCDLSENFLAAWLVSSYPATFDSLVMLCAGLTGFKWSSVLVAHLILLYGMGRLVAYTYRQWRSKV